MGFELMHWQATANFSALKRGELHLWRVNLDQAKDEYPQFWVTLNEQEKERALRFIAPAAKNNFVIARAILRGLLAKYLGVASGEIEFLQNKYGKLYVAGSKLQFNLSHSHGMAVFIFALDVAVGVDLELIRDNYEFMEIAQRFFAKSEYQQLSLLPIAQRKQAFFNCWARKEAFVKALGTGMFNALDRFAVEIFYGKVGKVKLLWDADNCDKERWRLESFDPSVNYVGAFAVNGLSEYQVSYYDFQKGYCVN